MVVGETVGPSARQARQIFQLIFLVRGRRVPYTVRPRTPTVRTPQFESVSHDVMRQLQV